MINTEKLGKDIDPGLYRQGFDLGIAGKPLSSLDATMKRSGAKAKQSLMAGYLAGCRAAKEKSQ